MAPKRSAGGKVMLLALDRFVCGHVEVSAIRDQRASAELAYRLTVFTCGRPECELAKGGTK